MAWADDIDAPGGAVRLSRSSLRGDVVAQSPWLLLEQARAVAGASLSLDRYSLARTIGSEWSSGRPVELMCLGDADLGKSLRKGVSVFDHVTGGTSLYGSQKSPRPVSTARDPLVRHLRAVSALLDDGGRGIARGAVQYLDAQTQLDQWQKGKNEHPLVVLDRWTFARPWKARLRDAQGRLVSTLGAPGDTGDQLEWVGAIDGVRPYRLMLFRRRTSAEAQRAAYEAAREIILSAGARGNELGTPSRPGVAVAAASLGVAVGLKVVT